MIDLTLMEHVYGNNWAKQNLRMQFKNKHLSILHPKNIEIEKERSEKFYDYLKQHRKQPVVRISHYGKQKAQAQTGVSVRCVCICGVNVFHREKSNPIKSYARRGSHFECRKFSLFLSVSSVISGLLFSVCHIRSSQRTLLHTYINAIIELP